MEETTIFKKIAILKNLVGQNGIIKLSIEYCGGSQNLSKAEKKALIDIGFDLNWVVKSYYIVRKKHGCVVENITLGYGDTEVKAINNAVENKKWLKIK